MATMLNCVTFVLFLPLTQLCATAPPGIICITHSLHPFGQVHALELWVALYLIGHFARICRLSPGNSNFLIALKSFARLSFATELRRKQT